MKDVVVELTTPITVHGGEQVRTVTLRAPKARDFFTLGNPFIWQTPKGGEPVLLEVPDLIEAYLQRCMKEPGPEFLAQVTLPDALRLQDAVMGFFVDARKAAYPQPATSSSLTSESSLQPSAAS